MFQGYPIDGNRWSENKSINRYQSIKLVHWYRLVSVNRWSIDNHTNTVHRLVSIGTATSNRRHARDLSDHPPLLGTKPGDEIGKTIPTQSSQRKEYTTLHVYSNHPSLPFRVIMSTQDVREEAWATCGGNAETRLKLLTIVVSSTTYSPSLWIPIWPHCSPVNPLLPKANHPFS